MYTFSSRLKTFAFVLMVLGILGIGYSFFTAPKTIEDVEKIVAEEQAHGHHGDAHAAPAHDAHGSAKEEHNAEAHAAPAEKPADTAHAVAVDSAHKTTDSVHAEAVVAAGHEGHDHDAHEGHEAHAEAAHGHDDAHAAHDEHHKHMEHMLHQLQNKPWSAVYVAALFCMLISLGALAFYAIQNAASAGWSPVLFRVMEAISAYLVPGAIIVYVLLVLGALDMHHIFIWMDEKVVAHDHLIQAKSGYLNKTFFLIRAALFMGGWILYRQYARKNSLAQDESNDNSYYKKNFKASAGFLVFFIVTESIMSWDWIMSVDPHWYSTLFGWYVFASFFVSGITTIAMITLYLKSKGYLEYVNTSHIHDLAKFMFGISVFWTYLWFSQFMLIWYADIPEEVTYFKTRIEDYNLPFFGMVAMNFVFPVLILINTDFKRLSWIVVTAGTVILAGHYIDFFNMIMPATVGNQWFIGAGEIGAILFFMGLFIFVVFTALTKAPLLAKRNPLIEESKHFHY
ncbi:quinol:cytochrome C oxidoreductase [Flavobacterium sp. MFBS3-15]|uniref:quinol:cytochrome C oxidoreductase n=1 Tax=Flavobacterium sp. MFBS3-15 TaxID=2989816 RepID=UPI0022356D63|nr:quinol:cytochrome C oxidoreductase [Flavobacterium sp. MFBS3-15]MCW4469436.1 quinol:cytochrome C oxidoreductase [Flavobacterium sp. MFBS3-15]